MTSQKKMRPEFEFKGDLKATTGSKHYITALPKSAMVDCEKCGKPAKFIHESEWNKEFECTDCGHVFYKS